MAEKEYIERETVYSLAKKVCKAVDSNPRVLLPRIILDLIDDLPAADVRPVVRGRWICGDSWSEGCGMGESYGFYYKCSVCKDEVQGGYKDCGMKYCPNCGADTRGESDV